MEFKTLSLQTFSLFLSLLSYLLFSFLFRTIQADGLGGIGDLAKILATLGGEDGCKFRCPNGVKPLANSKHIPTSNGCGSMGLQLDTSQIPGFTECCDDHDKCYDTCNNDRNQCDEDFKSCLSNVCLLEGLAKKMTKKQMQTCQDGADVMYSATVGLGCSAYKESQRNACLCNGEKLTAKQMQKVDEEFKDEL